MYKYLFYILLINVSISEFVVSGFITDKNSGEALIGANIYVLNSSLGVTTDKNGFYSITFNQKELGAKTVSIDLVIQYLGYERIIDKVVVVSRITS